MRRQDSQLPLSPLGRDLHRPECVLCTADGSVWTSDWRGGVTHIAADGSQTSFLCADSSLELRPNGIALLPDGSFLLANLGESGGVWRLGRDGSSRPFLTELDGAPLPPSNFVLVDAAERVWITVSTRHHPRALAYRSDVADGFVVLVDARGARIVADGLGYTNEVQVDPSGEWLWVNETFGRRTTRFRIVGDALEGPGEIVASFESGTYPDGLCFDAAGAAWIISPVSNRIIRVGAAGEQEIVFEDSDRDHVAWVEEAFRSAKMGRPHLDEPGPTRLKNLTSLAFGGPDLKTAVLGSLQGTTLAQLDLGVAGARPAHWMWM